MFKISLDVDGKNKIYKNKLDIEKLRNSLFKMSMKSSDGKQCAIFVFRHLDEEYPTISVPYNKRYIWKTGPLNSTGSAYTEIPKEIKYPTKQGDGKTTLGQSQSINIAKNLPKYVTDNNWADIHTINLHDPVLTYQNQQINSTGDPFETFYPYIRRLDTVDKYNSSATIPPANDPIVPTEGITDVKFFALSGHLKDDLTDVMTPDYIDAIYSSVNYSSVFCGTRDTLFGPKGGLKLRDGTLLFLLNQIFGIDEKFPSFCDYFTKGPPPKAGMFVYYFDSKNIGHVIRNDTLGNDWS
jgi:hypothetical protein